MPSALREFAGTLNVNVTLESPSETSGDAAVTWTVVGTDWMNMRALGGTEISGLEATADYQFEAHYRADITARWRIGLTGTTRKFNVTVPPQDPDGTRRRVLITAREIV